MYGLVSILISAGGLIISIMVMLNNKQRIDKILSNCINTLENKVKVLEDNKELQWRKFDSLNDNFHDLELRFVRLEQRINDTLKKMH